jgi:hypothetical protein
MIEEIRSSNPGRWEFISCHRQNDDHGKITAEVKVNKYFGLNAKHLEQIVEDMLFEVNEDRYEYTWEISPGIIVDRFPQDHIAILEVILRRLP